MLGPDHPPLERLVEADRLVGVAIASESAYALRLVRVSLWSCPSFASRYGEDLLADPDNLATAYQADGQTDRAIRIREEILRCGRRSWDTTTRTP